MVADAAVTVCGGVGRKAAAAKRQGTGAGRQEGTDQADLDYLPARVFALQMSSVRLVSRIQNLLALPDSLSRLEK